jgi:hypothetical protein
MKNHRLKTRRAVLLRMALSLPCSLLALLTTRAGNEIEAEVRFNKKLQVWDGFGVNYVEAAQMRDYRKRPQDYGGFSTLSEAI